jgi:glycosyltransferase involved in cell wall biosynthesis
VKIVFLNPSGALGGAETALLELIAAVMDARPSWSLALIAAAPGPLVDRAARFGITATPVSFPPSLARLGEWGRRGSVVNRLRLGAAAARAALPVLSYASQLRREIAGLDPDIVHTNGLKMHLLGAQCRSTRSKLVWHLHDYPDARPLTAALLRMSAKRCSAVVANSASVADRARGVMKGAHVLAVHNAVDLSRFRPDGPSLDLDGLAGLPPFASAGIRIGLVGTFAKWKGHDVFLRALAQVRTDVPVRGYVIGDSIYQTDASQYSVATLREMACRMGLNGNVGFTGHIADVPAALRSLDIVVHASVEPEPFGLVIAEAMACGRPVIVSHAGGAAEIAQGGALFHTPGNATELALRITQLVNEPTLRGALSKAGRTAAERLFSRKRLAETLIPVYEGVVSRSPAAPSYQLTR